MKKAVSRILVTINLSRVLRHERYSVSGQVCATRCCSGRLSLLLLVACLTTLFYASFLMNNLVNAADAPISVSEGKDAPVTTDAATVRQVLEQAEEHETDMAIRYAKSLSRAFRSAANQVIPSTVVIRGIFDESDFTSPLAFQPPESTQPDSKQFEEPLGSGVLVAGEGVVLTNNHVIDLAKQITIELADGRKFKPKEIRVDPKTDLAVILLDTSEKDLPAAKLGDSDQLEIGDWVLAIGNPFDLDLSVSAGIVSAKGRSFSATQRSNFIQTDAAINPGNSGGPLINLDGEVIGITTAIASRSGTYQGIAFAIPSNMARWVVDQLVSHGNVRRAFLGIAMRRPEPELAHQLGISPRTGVVVETIFDDSPGEKAGLRRGDIILSFDGKTVHNESELQSIIERSAIDHDLDIGIVRGDRKMTLQVRLQPMPGDFGERNLSFVEEEGTSYFRDKRLGVLLLKLNAESAGDFGFVDQPGLLVVDVQKNSRAWRAGLRDGMLIVGVDGNEVTDVQKYMNGLSDKSLEGEPEITVITPQGRQSFRLKQL